MSVHVFFDSLYYFFFSTYNFAVSPSGSTPIESVIMMLLAFLTLFYTRTICCRESSLIRSCNRRQIHIVLIRSSGVNCICRIIVPLSERILSCDRTYFSSAICMMRLTLLLLWSIMSGTRSTTTIEVSRPNAFGSSIPILLIRA